MLGGKIISKGGILYFYDKQYDLEIRIDKASSGIQELTPLYLVIKHSYLKNLMLNNRRTRSSPASRINN